MARGTEIVAIIAQEVFSTNDYQFATVKPIASIENDRLQPVRPGDFPNRDLCWWMVRNIAPIREVIPGRILVGQCQDADRYDPQDLDKDKYQLDGGTVRLGGPRSIIEIIAADCGPDPRQLINQNHVATLDHPPTSMVLAKLGDKVYGPFKTEFDQHGRRFHITLEKSKSFDYSHMFDLAKIRSDPGYISIKQISFSTDARPLNKSSDVAYSNYELLLWSRFESLQNSMAERIRLHSDEEVVRSAARQILSRNRLRDFMQGWNEIRDVYLSPQAAANSPEAAQVFSALSARIQTQSTSVEELIRGLLDSGLLNERINAVIDQQARVYLEENSARYEAEIAEKAESLRQEEETLRQSVQGLENEFERKRRHEEAVLQSHLLELRQDFEAWKSKEQATIDRERQELATKQKLVEKALDAASTRFSEQREDLLADFLSLSPFLSQIGARPPASEELHAPKKGEQAVDAPHQHFSFPLEARTTPGLMDEVTFFKRFSHHVEEAGYRFRPQDLTAFHLSVKCGDLTVLGGLSGTGKSSLPLLYAQALTGDQSHFLSVDVSPAWLEPGDLLGRANLLEEKFQPAATGLFEKLVWAAMESERLGKDSAIWIICLDEMNLAQPEHYFSGFLQALPRAGSQRLVSVFSPSSVRGDDPSRPYARIPLGPNLRFIGTVNYDETTKPLSQRFLDRTNQLQLEPVPFGNLHTTASTNIDPPSGPPVTVASFESWTREAPLANKAAALIDRMQKPLGILGSPLTPRRYQAIKRFVASAKGLCSSEEAFDIQLRQRVLSQLRGLFRPEARRALDELRTILLEEGGIYPGATHMLDRIYNENAGEIDFNSFDVTQ